MEVLVQQPCISNADTDLKNKYNDNTFLSKSISTEIKIITMKHHKKNLSRFR